jgi:hypothetical protein
MGSGLGKSVERISKFARFLASCFLLLLTPIAAQARCKILLVPGAFGSDASGRFLSPKDYFTDYEKFFRDQGCEVQRIQFMENARVELRGIMLRDQANKFLAKYPGEKAAIIAHSEGGIDARFAVKTLGLKNISSIVTIGTPHNGTTLADWVIHHRDARSPLYWLVRIFADYDLNQLPFVGEMTASFMDRQKDKFEAVPEVKYAAAQGVCLTHCHWALRLLDAVSGTHLIGEPGTGDGIIPASSQKFGQDLGSYDLDHISEVNVDPAKASERQRLLQSILEFVKAQ